MIVENIGYMQLAQVLALNLFCIYKTRKGTLILINFDVHSWGYHHCSMLMDFCRPKRDTFHKYPFKPVEGKKITSNAELFFDSYTADKNSLDTAQWNGGKQILAYKPYVYPFAY